MMRTCSSLRRAFGGAAVVLAVAGLPAHLAAQNPLVDSFFPEGTSSLNFELIAIDAGAGASQPRFLGPNTSSVPPRPYYLPDPLSIDPPIADGTAMEVGNLDGALSGVAHVVPAAMATTESNYSIEADVYIVVDPSIRREVGLFVYQLNPGDRFPIKFFYNPQSTGTGPGFVTRLGTGTGTIHANPTLTQNQWVRMKIDARTVGASALVSVYADWTGDGQDDLGSAGKDLIFGATAGRAGLYTVVNDPAQEHAGVANQPHYFDNVVITFYPRITTQPQDVVVETGGDATFTVAATGTGTLTYQWRRNGVDIPGENSTTLFLPSVTVADTGHQFDVIVTDDIGPTQSRAALLTVTVPECNKPFADANGDGFVDMDDFGMFQVCYTGAGNTATFDPDNCSCFDRDNDGDIDGDDLVAFTECWSGPAIPADQDCGEAIPVIVFQDNFSIDSAANWMVVDWDETRTTFAYDYSADGIPPAPNGTGTRGLKFEANMTPVGAVAAVTASPIGLSVSGRYTVEFDMWINANGPFPGGGVGSTEYVTAGIGYDGFTVNRAVTGSGGWFAVNGEGGSGNQDFRAYKDSSTQFAESGQFAAGLSSAGGVSATNAHNRAHPYYHTAFPGGQEPPPLQQATYAQQTGGLNPGTVGFAWRQVKIRVEGTTAEWSIDGLVIATLDSTVGASFPLSGNISIGYWDPFTSVSDNEALSFGLIDNLVVTEWQQP